MTTHLFNMVRIWEIIKETYISRDAELSQIANDLRITQSTLIAISNQTIQCKPLKLQYTLYKRIEMEYDISLEVSYPEDFTYDESVLFPERVKYFMQYLNISKCNIAYITRMSKTRLDDILSSKKEPTIFEKYAISSVIELPVKILDGGDRYAPSDEYECMKTEIVRACYIRDLNLEDLANKSGSATMECIKHFYVTNEIQWGHYFNHLLIKQLGVYTCPR